jgi:FtsP/CotA-like multicopper oxidase with cupredoxin domain
MKRAALWRRIIRGIAPPVALALVAAACATASTRTSVVDHSEHAAPAATPTTASNTGGTTMTMLQMEEAKVKAFPAKTQGTGGAPLRGRLVNGVKVFDITATAVRWEVSPGQFADAYAYNGQIPGPELRVKRGDRVQIVFHNALPEASSIHFHGVTLPNAMDGVPFITQPPVMPGESFTYAWRVVDNPGTYMYHSHENAVEQVSKGLLGAFVIEPASKSWDIEQTLVLGDGALGFTINGKGFPATSPLVAKRGKRVLIRFMNAGQLLHPMHLHGFHFTVVARDGRPVESPYDLDTLVVAPGERFDVLFSANLLGVWAFHCHILSHVEGPQGMFGMVTALVVK